MLMKKIALLLFGLLAMFSCEQEDLEGIESNTVQVQTRAVTSIADFAPINELTGIPMNILNVGNTRRSYLSCVESGDEVDLFTEDDGSLRQRWMIAFSDITLVGGNTSFPSFPGLGMGVISIIPNSKSGETYPKLLRIVPNMTHGFELLSNGNYYIFRTPYSSSDPKVYLQSDTRSGSDLKYKYDHSTDLSQWTFAPVGEYELVDLEYVYTSVDNFKPTEIICDRDTYENSSSSLVTWNYTVTTRYTESSSFSKTEGVSVSISNGLSVGLPSVEGSPSMNMNTTIQQQTSKSWTYGNSDSKEITKTRTGNIPVQPHTTMKLEAVVFMYEGTVTYVATLRKIGDTRTFRVKGKWEGACYSDFKARTYDVTTGKLLNTYSLE